MIDENRYPYIWTATRFNNNLNYLIRIIPIFQPPPLPMPFEIVRLSGGRIVWGLYTSAYLWGLVGDVEGGG
jgi:hypothetical protein